MRVTDSGLTGLRLGAMRAGAGDLQLGLVVSWNQSSVGPLEDIARMRGEPFYLRPIGLNFAIADGLFAGAVAARHGIAEADVAERVRLRMQAAATTRAPCAARCRSLAEIAQIAAASPIRCAAAIARRSPTARSRWCWPPGDWLRAHPGKRPLARIAGAAWAVDRYQLDARAPRRTRACSTRR